VPLGLLLLVAVAVLPLPGRRQAEVGDRLAGGQRAHLRVMTEVADEQDFVEHVGLRFSSRASYHSAPASSVFEDGKRTLESDTPAVTKRKIPGTSRRLTVSPPARSFAAMAIRFEQLSKSYEARAVVSNVSLTVESGGLCVLLGPSGSGKSTLLRLAAGLVAPDAGRIEI